MLIFNYHTAYNFNSDDNGTRNYKRAVAELLQYLLETDYDGFTIVMKEINDKFYSLNPLNMLTIYKPYKELKEKGFEFNKDYPKILNLIRIDWDLAHFKLNRPNVQKDLKSVIPHKYIDNIIEAEKNLRRFKRKH